VFAHQPPPRSDGVLPVTITHLELSPHDWTRRGIAPALPPSIEPVRLDAPSYRALYDAVGKPWLWYERHEWSDAELQAHLDRPGHEVHVALSGGDLVGYFELEGDEIEFFGLALPWVGKRIGPWLLDRAIERGFARGSAKLVLNTNTVDHPRALDTYRKAGFKPVRTERKELRDPRVTWPDRYRWPPA